MRPDISITYFFVKLAWPHFSFRWFNDLNNTFGATMISVAHWRKNFNPWRHYNTKLGFQEDSSLDQLITQINFISVHLFILQIDNVINLRSYNDMCWKPISVRPPLQVCLPMCFCDIIDVQTDNFQTDYINKETRISKFTKEW